MTPIIPPPTLSSFPSFARGKPLLHVLLRDIDCPTALDRRHILISYTKDFLYLTSAASGPPQKLFKKQILTIDLRKIAPIKIEAQAQELFFKLLKSAIEDAFLIKYCELYHYPRLTSFSTQANRIVFNVTKAAEWIFNDCAFQPHLPSAVFQTVQEQPAVVPPKKKKQRVKEKKPVICSIPSNVDWMRPLFPVPMPMHVPMHA
jgi:hypothetical protein